MSETQIQELIETAIAQLAFSYTPYSHFKVGAALLAKTDGSIQDAISRMRRTRRRTVPSGPLFSRQSAKGSGNLKRSAL